MFMAKFQLPSFYPDEIRQSFDLFGQFAICGVFENILSGQFQNFQSKFVCLCTLINCVSRTHMSGPLNFLVWVVLTDVFIQKGRVGIPFKQWMRTVCTLHKPPHPHPSSSLLTYIFCCTNIFMGEVFFLRSRSFRKALGCFYLGRGQIKAFNVMVCARFVLLGYRASGAGIFLLSG
jgi:hypothetical protein